MKLRDWLLNDSKRMYTEDAENHSPTVADPNESSNILWKEVTACLSAALFHIPFGLSLSYSAILVSQLEKVDSDIPVTQDESAWIASLIGLVVPLSSLVTGYLMDAIGRLHTIQLAALPFFFGFLTMGAAANFQYVIVGRVMTAVAMAMGTNPSIVYTAEIARPSWRGCLSSAGPLLSSFGLLMGYVLGSMYGWRMVAYISAGFVLIPLATTFIFSAESPEWLLSKGKSDQAMESLQYLTDDPTVIGVAYSRLEILEEKIQAKREKYSDDSWRKFFQAYLEPSGYKPLLMLMTLFCFQQLSGIYITISYAVTYFQDISSDINGSVGSIYLGLSRFLGGILAVYLLKKVNRRPLLIFSSLVMAICMFIAGYYSLLISQGLSTSTWIPTLAIVVYMFISTIGLFSVPWVMTGEIFPLRYRGVLQGTAISWAFLALFFAVRSYRPLLEVTGGVYGVQFIFAVSCLLSIAFVWMFLPETHNQNLDQIEEYFEHNIIYLGKKRSSYSRISP